MSVRVEVVRKGTEASNTASVTDGGVLAVLAVVSNVIDICPDESSTHDMLVGALSSAFSSVKDTAQGPDYKWVSNPEPPPDQAWLCCRTWDIEVDDESPNPILVNLEVGTPGL